MNALEHRAMSALDELRQKQTETAQDTAVKLAEGFTKKFDTQPPDVIEYAPQVVFETEGLVFIAEYGEGWEKLYWLARHCPKCGWVKAGIVYNLETLGERLAPTAEHWLAMHDIEAHSTQVTKVTVINALMEKIDDAYKELVQWRESYLIDSGEKARLETMLADDLGRQLMEETITGKNEAERKAKHQLAEPGGYDELWKATERQRFSQIKYDKANLEVERVRALLRCYELAHQMEIV